MRKKVYTQQDGTPKVLATPRQEGTTLYFTSRGDDIVNNIIGRGNILSLSNTSALQETYVEAQFLEDVYLKDGIAFWKNAVGGDEISVEVVLPANTPLYINAQTGNYDKDNDGNFIPNLTWTGSWLILPQDHVLDRFVNSVLLLGDNTHGLILESSTSGKVPKECKFRIKLYSETYNPNIILNVCLELYREHTV